MPSHSLFLPSAQHRRRRNRLTPRRRILIALALATLGAGTTLPVTYTADDGAQASVPPTSVAPSAFEGLTVVLGSNPLTSTRLAFPSDGLASESGAVQPVAVTNGGNRRLKSFTIAADVLPAAGGLTIGVEQCTRPWTPFIDNGTRTYACEGDEKVLATAAPLGPPVTIKTAELLTDDTAYYRVIVSSPAPTAEPPDITLSFARV